MERVKWAYKVEYSQQKLQILQLIKNNDFDKYTNIFYFIKKFIILFIFFIFKFVYEKK